MILETIISTISEKKILNISPFGIKKIEEYLLISPYLPSTTHNNLLSNKCASISYTDNANIFVECILKKTEKLKITKCSFIDSFFLSDSLKHEEVKVVKYLKDEVRPTFKCKIIHSEKHGSFISINRARNAIIEACILATRTKFLPKKKILNELDYLENALYKTSGKEEEISWRNLRIFIEKNIRKDEK